MLAFAGDHDRRRRSVLGAAVIALVVLVCSLALAARAQAANCSVATSDYAYNGACGPEFELPNWGDAGGWTDPSKYSTIQLADLTGNGVDELLARNDDGLDIWWFDTKVGQWRPALGADGLPEVLTDFASPRPGQRGPNWTQPQYYSTIQTADLDGPGKGADIIARFPSGIRVYHYTPPSCDSTDPSCDSKSINGGTWSLVSQDGPFSDADGYTDPSLYLSIHAFSGDGTAAHPGGLFAQSKSGPVVYWWTGTGWRPAATQPAGGYSNNPADYLNFKSAVLPSDDGTIPALINFQDHNLSFKRRYPQAFYTTDASSASSTWKDLGGGQLDPPLSDCSGTPTCFGYSPSYYETMRFADVDGDGQDELLARTSDGLELYKLRPGWVWQHVPSGTITDLKGSAEQLAATPGRWASIRTGDILGNHQDQVLALDGTGLQAWSYDDATEKWNELPATVPLDLSGKAGSCSGSCTMWDSDASYYSTIQVGDVTGPGDPDAVIARGPFGIRTWFYCAEGDTREPCASLDGKSGWTSWQPQDTSSYPQFSGDQAKAFEALNELAKDNNVIPRQDDTVRDVWTASNAPTENQLNTLRQGLLGFADCSGPGPSQPVQYQTCKPPAGTSEFSAEEWTAVVNEILSEIYSAGQVVDLFNVLNDTRVDLFLSQGAALPAIAAKLKLAGAAENETTMDPIDFFSSTMKIAASLSSLAKVNPFIKEGLSILGSLISMIPSASPSAISEFDGTYSDLQQKFAEAVPEADRALATQSTEVRQSYGLLSLVSQLRQGPWAMLDTIGIKGVTEQAFATWIYQKLLPTMYVRYQITNCVDGTRVHCKMGVSDDPCSAPGIVAGQNNGRCTPNFDMIGPPPSGRGGGSIPCWDRSPRPAVCTYSPLPEEIGNTVWAPISPDCDYDGSPQTVWHYGCSLGVNPYDSISFDEGPASDWDFTTYVGDPVVAPGDAPTNPVRMRGSATVGPNGTVRISGTIPASSPISSATASPAQVLSAPGSGPLLTAAARGSAAAASRPQVRVRLGTVSGQGQAFTLTVRRADLALPAACEQLPASESLQTPPVELDTTLMVKEGDERGRLSLPGVWRCVRGRDAAVTKLVTARGVAVTRRPGLRASISGPRTIVAGRKATYVVRVRGRRRRHGNANAVAASLWHVTVHGVVSSARLHTKVVPVRKYSWSRRRLRPGRSITLRLRVRPPRTSAGRACVTANVGADSARSVVTRRCFTVVRRGRR